MSDFIASLDSPLGIPKPNTLALVSFDLPIAKGDKIHCLDVLHSLTKYTLGFVDDGSEDFSKVSYKLAHGLELKAVSYSPCTTTPLITPTLPHFQYVFLPGLYFTTTIIALDSFLSFSFCTTRVRTATPYQYISTVP